MSNDNWFVARWDDKSLLSGTNVLKVLREIDRIAPAGTIIVSRFEGRGRGAWKMPRGDLIQLFDWKRLAAVLTQLEQVEWCDFYFPLHDSYDAAVWTSPYRDILPHTLCTLLAVDGHLLVMYTKDAICVDLFAVACPDADVEQLTLEQLQFPY